MHIGVPLEKPRRVKTRVAATPETIKKLIGQGHKVTVQSGAGINASVVDTVLIKQQAQPLAAPTCVECRLLILEVVAPSDSRPRSDQERYAVCGGHAQPVPGNETIAKLAECGITAFALEAAPRTSTRPGLDVAVSNLLIAGYKSRVAGLSCVHASCRC